MKAYSLSKTSEEARDRRSTPRWLVRAIQHQLGISFDYDVCAEPETSITGIFHWTKEDDSLSLDWGELNYYRTTHRYLWMNPPYSDPRAWCKKAADESRKHGFIIVGLLPDDRSTAWYKNYIHGVCNNVLVTPSRIPFINPDTGKEQDGNPKGSIIPIWTPWRSGVTVETYLSADLMTLYKNLQGAKSGA